MSIAESPGARAAGWQPHTRVVALSVAASIVVHVLVLVAFPGFARRDLKPPEPLQVTFDTREPPRVIPPAPEPERQRTAPSKPQPRKEKPVQTLQPAPAPRPIERAPDPPVLALPSPPAPVEPGFTVPAPEPRPETEATVARGASAKPQGPGAEKGAPVTPANFDAAYLNNAKPPYPRTAQTRGEEGTVLVRVFVTREGLPDKVSVEKTSGYTSLDRAAVEAVKGWRFAPARQGAQTVDSWVHVPMVFKLDRK